MSTELKPSMPWYYSLVAYLIFGGLLFIGSKYVDIFDVDATPY